MAICAAFNCHIGELGARRTAGPIWQGKLPRRSLALEGLRCRCQKNIYNGLNFKLMTLTARPRGQHASIERKG